jgi:hypothetical protein
MKKTGSFKAKLGELIDLSKIKINTSSKEEDKKEKKEEEK